MAIAFLVTLGLGLRVLGSTSFTDCGSDTAPIRVTDVVLDPENPRPGDTMNIVINCDATGDLAPEP